MPATARELRFHHSDGGRELAGFNDSAADCGARAAAIVTGRDYRTTYDELFTLQRAVRTRNRKPAVKRRTASPRAGLPKQVMHVHMTEAGAEWIALATIVGDVVRVAEATSMPC